MAQSKTKQLIEEQVKSFKEEITVTEEEILFWLRRTEEIEKEHDRLENDIFSNNNERLEELENEFAAIYKRMRRETAGLADFKERYNKLAKKSGLKLID